MTPPRTEIAGNPEELALRTADWIAGLIAAHDGPFRFVLTGGSTPRPLYRELSERRGDWSKVEFYWTDERCVPPDHPDSNYHMARETLLSRIAVKPAQVHRIPTDESPESCARRYEDLLHSAYGADKLDPARPLFDFALLGLGGDGHICSLLPQQPVLEEVDHWVAPVPFGRPEMRITLTYPCIQASRTTAYLVTGHEKAEAVKRVRAGDISLPGGRLRPNGELVWLLDQDAATLL